MYRTVWLAVLLACGDNRARSDAGVDQTVCDPAACPSDRCHLATCVDNACAQIDVSRCATPFCALAGCGLDGDGDGLSDAWESQHYVDMNCDGAYDATADVPLEGADPERPDVYVRYDYMASVAHSHQPPPAALDQIAQAYAARGIALHWLAPAASIAEHLVTTRDPNPTQACAGSDVVTLRALRESAFASPALGPSAVHPAYHYLVFAHNAVLPDTALDGTACPTDPECGGHPDPTASGDSDVVGDDAIVALGYDVDLGIQLGIERWAGTTMHELGHNFGLVHGSLASAGQHCLAYKPNYVSVMGYSYQNGIRVGAAPGSTAPLPCASDADCSGGPCATPGACHCTDDLGAGNYCYRIDYSNASLLALDEAMLDESAGVGGASTDRDVIVYCATGTGCAHFGPSSGPIDWNLVNGIESSAQGDVDNSGAANTTLTTTTDWDKLRFAFQCAPQAGAR